MYVSMGMPARCWHTAVCELMTDNNWLWEGLVLPKYQAFSNGLAVAVLTRLRLSLQTLMLSVLSDSMSLAEARIPVQPSALNSAIDAS